MKLYEIAAEYQAFLDAVEAGEIPEEAIGDTFVAEREGKVNGK